MITPKNDPEALNAITYYHRHFYVNEIFVGSNVSIGYVILKELALQSGQIYAVSLKE